MSSGRRQARRERGRRRRGVGIGTALLGCLAAAGLVAGLVFDVPLRSPWAEAGTPLPAATLASPRGPEWDAAPSVLAGVGEGAEPAGAGTTNATPVAHVLDGPAAAPALGGRVGVSVVDLASGTQVYESGSTTPQTPASTLKILTATAALHTLGPDHRFTTRVVTAAPGLTPSSTTIVLVGGGDPYLTAADTHGRARLGALADATVVALAQAGATTVSLGFDDSLFAGPPVDPDWRPDYVPAQVAPVSALAVDIQDNPEADPASTAATVFADLLRKRGIGLTADPVRSAAPAEAVEVAAVESAPLSAVVEEVLTTSDNDGAEMLARHVAIGAGLPGSFDGASQAVPQVLGELGIDVSRVRLLDGSGLARGSVIPAAVLAATLALAANPDQPGLRPVVTGLPVAGFSGTLADRFDGAAGSAAGLVRAKTGSLTGVSSLAGVVVAQSGTTYAFAVLADQVSNTVEARNALDTVAAALASCGCR